MKEMKWKKVGMKQVVFSLIFLFTLIMFASTSAKATSKTSDEAIAWVKSQCGKSIDYDDVYGAQCVDLIKAYYAYLGVSPVTGNGYTGEL